MSAEPRAASAAAFALAALVLLGGLGSYGLVEKSDARYAEIAWEMHRSGDFLVPTLLGIRHFHKPPLIYWLTQPGLILLGPTGWGARAAQAALGFALLGLLHRFARRHLTGAAAWSVAIAATTPAVIGAARMLTIDLLLALLVTAALLAWHELRSGSGGTGTRLLLWGALGAAFLAKGPVAWLVPALIAVPAAILDRRTGLHRGRPLGAAWGIPLALAIALPWYLVVAAKTPGLLSYFLGAQVAGRLREGGLGHPHPWHYFALVFPALGMPWVLLAASGWRAVRRRDPPLATLLGLWALVPPLFFSLPATKLPLYVLPAFPAIALLAGAAVADREGPRPPLRSAGILLVILGTALGAAGLGAVPLRGGDLATLPAGALRALLLPAAAVLVAGGAAAAALARRPPRAAAAVAASMGGLVAALFLGPADLPLRSLRTVGTAVARELHPGDLLVAYRVLPHGLPFYAGDDAPMPIQVAVPREVQFEPAGSRPPLMAEPEFLARLGGERRLLVVVDEHDVARLPPLRELARGEGFALLANR